MSGSPMVLLHGVTDTPRTWDLVRDRLAEQHELLLPTLLGHHGGAPYAGDPSPDAIADQVERDMDAAGLETAHLVGNSLGGGIALMLAARGRAKTVVGLAPAGGWPEDDVAGQQQRVSFFRLVQNLVKEAAPRADEIASTAEGRARALAFMVEHPERVPADLVAHQIRGAADCDIVMPLVELTATEGFDLQAIDVPVRIVWGTEDKVLAYPHTTTRFKETLPDADWVVLEGIGHAPQLDDPDRTAELILEFTSR